MVDARRVGPVCLGSDNVESVLRDELLCEPGPETVELAGSVCCLAEEDDPRVANSRDQRLEVSTVDVGEGLCLAGEQGGDRRRFIRRPLRRGAGATASPSSIGLGFAAGRPSPHTSTRAGDQATTSTREAKWSNCGASLTGNPAAGSKPSDLKAALASCSGHWA